MKKRESAPSMATMYDVARLAGVSAMTVSRVMNGYSKVSDATRAKVTAAILLLNYQVNTAARVARVGPIRVGLLYSNPSSAYLSTFLIGAMEQCSLSGGQLILETCSDLRSQRKAVSKLVDAGADGILVPPPLCDSASALRQLDEVGVPVVAVATGKPIESVSAVRIDDYEGAMMMMQHLLSQGFTDIAFIKGDRRHTPAKLRYQAYVDSMAQAGLRVLPERIAQGMFTYRSGLNAARQLLCQETRPSAIFAANDEMAAAVIAVAHGMHIDVPNDLVVCGFDDTPVATSVWPELTTIQQPISEMARAAVDMLLEQIKCRRSGGRVHIEHKLMPFALIPRESSLRRS